MAVIEQLKHEAELLPEPLAQEVLDFLLFVRSRHSTAGWAQDFLNALPEHGKENRSNAPPKVSLNSVWNWNRATSSAFYYNSPNQHNLVSWPPFLSTIS